MNKEEKMKEMMNKKVWAVIGATPNAEKTSNRIYHTFLSHGYKVYAVNPNYEKMDDGSKCYKCLQDLPKIPDCVDFVIPPQATMATLEELDPSVYPLIWLQPGTYNDEIVEFATKKGFSVVHEGCCTMAYLKATDEQG